MTVRGVTPADLPAIEELWRAFEAEVPPPAHEPVDPAAELAEIRAIVESGLGWLAEREGAPVGFALARRRGPRIGRITDVYVTPSARRAGVATALVRAAAERLAAEGMDVVDLEVMASNAQARAVYGRWGFRDEVLVLTAPVSALVGRLEAASGAASFGSIHAQTDDADVIARAVEMLVPRLPGRSAGSIVSEARDGYVAVYDDVCDRDPSMLRRLAKEISSRTGLVVITLGLEEDAVVRMIIFDRGGIVDEYASVPEFHGPLPPGEVIAMHANPVVVERYTGASQASIRAAAPLAGSPSELPPAQELLAGLAAAMGLSGAEHGWADAPAEPGQTRIDRR